LTGGSSLIIPILFFISASGMYMAEKIFPDTHGMSSAIKRKQ
jgi:hypothetical protein